MGKSHFWLYSLVMEYMLHFDFCFYVVPNLILILHLYPQSS